MILKLGGGASTPLDIILFENEDNNYWVRFLPVDGKFCLETGLYCSVNWAIPRTRFVCTYTVFWK